MSDIKFDMNSPITEGGITIIKPKQAKGGVFAPADIKLIKAALLFYVQHNGEITDAEESQAANLLHRLNNRI